MILIIAEKPSVAVDIARCLFGANHSSLTGRIDGQNEDVEIVAASGHLMELMPPEYYDPAWANWRWGHIPYVPPGYQFRKRPSGNDKLATIGRRIKEAREIVNACDAGREGELIFREIIDHFGAGGATLSRMWIQANTPKALNQAFFERYPADSRNFPLLAAAADARQKADWLFGINMTVAVTLGMNRCEYPGTWHVGRVQTPTLGILYGRHLQITHHGLSRYWKVSLELMGKNEVYRAHLLAPQERRFGTVAVGFADEKDATDAEYLARTRYGRIWEVEDITEDRQEFAPQLFNLAELQKAASLLWGWSAKETIDTAQILYQKGAISYPRTDSRNLPNEMEGQCQNLCQWLYSEYFIPSHTYPDVPPVPDISLDPKKVFNNRKVTDHYAIVPLPSPPDRANLREHQLWDLIARRFFVAWFPPAKILHQERAVASFDEGVGLHGTAQRDVLTDPGWLTADRLLGQTDPRRIPLESRHLEPLPICEGPSDLYSSQVYLVDVEPPEEHTDASLIHLMVRRGLGTAATRAAIIEDLITRGYAVRNGRRLDVADRGKTLIEAINWFGCGDAVSSKMTGAWEKILTKMTTKSKDKVPVQDFLMGVVSSSRGLCERIHDKIGATEPFGVIGRVEIEATCPLTLKPVVDCGDYYEFPSHPGIEFKKVLYGRAMSVADYSSIVLAGNRPAGPFNGFVPKAYHDTEITELTPTYSAKLKLRPRLGRVELVLNKKKRQ